ncbi:hypothetical protein SAMN05216412_103151 [Nitrosospira multiformis]|uniref:Uncharacterized protein n=1 Tax=Nitrosospira multiformis TaxID=1231 RepID=A0A1I0BVV7_9PROT|nr:hypothetical protein SAMN05216412_103151 [Nitrosospira multiformis]
MKKIGLEQYKLHQNRFQGNNQRYEDLVPEQIPVIKISIIDSMIFQSTNHAIFSIRATYKPNRDSRDNPNA